jgi:hypothetical protein
MTKRETEALITEMIEHFRQAEREARTGGVLDKVRSLGAGRVFSRVIPASRAPLEPSTSAEALTSLDRGTSWITREKTPPTPPERSEGP